MIEKSKQKPCNEILYPKTLTYKKNLYQERRALLEELARGQQPKSLIITCSDSRICVNELTSTKPGEVFVIRNAGNVIEAYHPENPSNEALTLEFGVKALGISEVIVCGHTNCGAMQGIQQLDSLKGLDLAATGLRRIAKQFSKAQIEENDLPEFIKLNVKRQMKNLLTYPFIKEAIDSNKLNLWGWVYDFVKGEITTKMNATEI